MIPLGGVKTFKGGNFRDNLIGIVFLRFQKCLLGCSFLFFAVVKDHRTVLGSIIRPLFVECGRIVGPEKDIKQVLIRDCLGVKGYLN